MGYPPLPNYPQPGNFHQDYPLPPAKSIAYEHHPPQSFSYSQCAGYRQLDPDTHESGSAFIRFLIILLIVLLVVLCAMTLIIWLLFGTEIPDISVTSVSVPVFNITNSTTLFATWDANITINNSDENLEVQVKRARSCVFHGSNILAVGYMDPFGMTQHSKRDLPVNLSTRGMLQNPKQSVLEQLRNERDSGMMTFSLRLVFEAEFKSSSLWRIENLKVYCEDLKVLFSDDTGVGKLMDAPTHECLLFS